MSAEEIILPPPDRCRVASRVIWVGFKPENVIDETLEHSIKRLYPMKNFQQHPYRLTSRIRANASAAAENIDSLYTSGRPL